MSILLTTLAVAIGIASCTYIDLDKTLEYADLKLEVIGKVKNDLLNHISKNDGPKRESVHSIQEFMKKSVRRRTNHVFKQLDEINRAPTYRNLFKNRLLEGVVMNISNNVSTFKKPLIKNTILYKVNSASK